MRQNPKSLPKPCRGEIPPDPAICSKEYNCVHGRTRIQGSESDHGSYLATCTAEPWASFQVPMAEQIFENRRRAWLCFLPVVASYHAFNLDADSFSFIVCAISFFPNQTRKTSRLPCGIWKLLLVTVKIICSIAVPSLRRWSEEIPRNK